MATINGTPNNDNLTGTDANDIISGLEGNDKITGGLGADTLYGNEGDDEFLLGSPDIVTGETIDGGSGINAISVFGATNLSVISFTNIQTLNIHHPTVTLSAAQFSSLNKVWAVSSAPSTLVAADAGTYDFSARIVAGATFTFVGSAGNDTIIGNNVAQNITGGLGADILTGNDGADIFTYKASTESTVTQTDTITDFFKGVDRIDLTGLNFRGITTNAPPEGWLQLSYNSALHVTTLADLGGSNFAIKLNGNHLALDSTDFIGLAHIIGTSGDDYLRGTPDIDKISGFDGNDILQGLGGADTMLGGNGDDDFLVGFDEAIGDVIDGGTGNNKISSWNADLSQTNISNVQTLIANIDKVILTAGQFAGFVNLFNYASSPISLQAVTAGNYELSSKIISGAFDLLGSTGDDYLAGDNNSQTLNGSGGNDVLQGLGSADNMFGGEGDDDFLVGFDETIGDVIDGGAGNNKISSWNADLSQATISNVQTLITNLDMVKLTAAQFAGFNSVSNFTNSAVAIQAAVSGHYSLANKNVVGTYNLFGSAGNDTLIGNAAAQILNGGLGADILTGNAGADLFAYASITESTTTQTDIITDFVKGTDKIDLTGLGFNSITTAAAQPGQLNVTYNAALDRTTIADANGSNFAFMMQGNHLDLADNDFIGLFNIINGTSSNDYLPGSAQQDIIAGLDGNDVLQGLGRADTMLGGNGDDEFLVGYDEAVGDIIDGGAGYNKIASWNADLSQASIKNVQTLITNLDIVKLTEQQLNEFSNIINYGNNTVVIQGAIAGNYDFSYKAMQGALSFVGSDGMDTIRGTNGITIHGGMGDDYIHTSILGSAEQLYGDAGDDTFLIESYPSTPLAGAVIDGGEGYNTVKAEWLHLYEFTIKNIQHLDFRNSVVLTGEQLSGITTLSGNGTIYGAFAGTYDLTNKIDNDNITRFFEGSGGDDIIIGNEKSQRINGNSGNDTIYGNGGNNIIRGDFGIDTIYGGVTDDTLDGEIIYGGEGNDTLFAEVNNIEPVWDNYFDGGEGNDTMSGQNGKNTLIGGTGNDTYLISNGDSLIIENDNTPGNSDSVSFTPQNAMKDELWFTHSDNDLLVRVIGTMDQVRIKDWYSGSAHHVESFHVAEGYALLNNNVQNLVNAMASLTFPSTTTLSPEYHAQLDAIIAANWT